MGDFQVVQQQIEHSSFLEAGEDFLVDFFVLEQGVFPVVFGLVDEHGLWVQVFVGVENNSQTVFRGFYFVMLLLMKLLLSLKSCR